MKLFANNSSTPLIKTLCPRTTTLSSSCHNWRRCSRPTIVLVSLLKEASLHVAFVKFLLILRPTFLSVPSVQLVLALRPRPCSLLLLLLTPVLILLFLSFVLRFRRLRLTFVDKILASIRSSSLHTLSWMMADAFSRHPRRIANTRKASMMICVFRDTYQVDFK